MADQQPFQAVQQRKGDPFIYLYVMGEWYCYNPQEQPLGGCAMGDVYRGYRCKTGAPIAVKRVKDSYANNPMIRERARQEASLAFRHNNLVEMIGYCEYAPTTGPIFLLSHFVQGVDIDEYVKSFDGSPNRVEKICHAIYSVLDALDYVHSKGVIHRDIKPSNIMVENGSNVRLMDLGISRMNGGNKFSSLGFIGTPEYSAPEQIHGKEQINATTDIYELGITFYELLTGVNPMSCESETDTLTKQTKEPLPANPLIPKKLMRVIWKATEKEQAKRYQTALDFKRAIQQALMPDPSKWEQFKTWAESHVLLLVAAVVGFLLVVALIIILILTFV
jgi:serine/threonine-protein kinase